MSSLSSKNLKMIVLQEKALPKNELNDPIILCRTIDEFKKILMKNRSSTLIIACAEDKLFDIAPLITDLNLHTVCVLTNQGNIAWPIELVGINWESIGPNDQNRLMRSLSSKALLFYTKQAMEYEKTGDNGLKGLYLRLAMNAADQFEQFI